MSDPMHYSDLSGLYKDSSSSGAMPDTTYDSDIFALYQDPSFSGAKPEEQADFLGAYFDRTVGQRLKGLDGVNLEDSRRRFVSAHLLGPGCDAEVAGLYASTPDFAAAAPGKKEKFLGELFDKKLGQDAKYVDAAALKDSRNAFIARNLPQADRHSLYGVGAFAKDFAKDLPQGVFTTMARAGRQAVSMGVVPMEPELELEVKPNFIRPDGSGFVDRQVAKQDRAALVSELRYGDNPIVGHGSFIDPLGAKHSSGYSLSSTVPSAALGLAFGPAGAIGGAAVTGPMIALASKDQFLTDAVGKASQAMRREKGRGLTQDEADELVAQLDAAATQYGAWEAIPEMVSNAIFGSVLGGALKTVVKGAGVGARAARLGLGGAASLAGEHATETVTGYGQGALEAEHGLREAAPTLGEAFREQFPVTNAQMLMSHGSAALVGKVAKPGLVRGAERLGIINPVRPGEHRDLLAETDAPAQPSAPTPPGEGGYAADAVSRRYQEAHAAPFPSAAELMRMNAPQVRPGMEAAQARGLGLAPTEYRDAPGYSEWDVRRRYEEGHAAPFPKASELSPMLWEEARPDQAAGLGLGGVSLTGGIEARPFSPAELAATAPQRETPPEASHALSGEEAHARAQGEAGGSFLVRADGKPFPTRRAAESQAERLRRAGRSAVVTRGPAGGFVLAVDSEEASGDIHTVDTRQAVSPAEGVSDEQGAGSALGVLRAGDGTQGAGAAGDGVGGQRPFGAAGIDSAQDVRRAAAGRFHSGAEGQVALGRRRDVSAASGELGERFGARYELRELSNIRASHDPLNQFAKTEGYPDGVQDRPYHSSRAHQEQVAARVARFDPEQIVNTSATAEGGPSIVTADGVVLGGNNRKMLLDIVSAKHPERYGKYLKSLREEASAFGFAPQDVDRFERPVLVRVLDFSSGDKSMQELGRISGVLNKPSMTGQDRVSRGVAAAKGLDRETLTVFAAGVGGYDTLRDYLGSPHAVQQLVPRLERDGILDIQNRDNYLLDGRLTPEGKNVIEDAVRGFVIPDNDLLQRLRRAGADEMRSLDFALPHMAFLKASGEEWVSGSMGRVLRLFLDYNANRKTWMDKHTGKQRKYEPEFYLQQPSLLGDVAQLRDDPLVVAQFRALVHYTPREFAAVWKSAAELLRDLQSRPTMPGISIDSGSIRRVVASAMREYDAMRSRIPASAKELEREAEPQGGASPQAVAGAARSAVPAKSGALPQGVFTVSSRVMSALQEGRKITWRELQRWANEGFGGTQAEGKWDIKEAYDAMEMGVNAQIRRGWTADGRPFNPGRASAAQMKEAVAKLEQRVLDLLPTQTRRSEAQMELQQFSTPPTLAAVAVWAARPGPGDVVLEPSAGIGGLSIFAHNAGAEVHMNELDPRRRAMLEHMNYGVVTGENAEQLHNILPESVRPTLVVMNPPFSSTAGRKQGERKTRNVTRHLDQALARLEPGGRLVAILSQGMSADKRFMAHWWDKVRKANTLRANIKLDGAIYKKYGTSFDNLLVVVDKVPPIGDTYVNAECKTLDEAIDALSEVRDVRENSAERLAPEPGGQEGPGKDARGGLAGLPVRAATGALGAGEREGAGGGLPAGGRRGGAAVPVAPGVGHEGDSGAGGPGERRGRKRGGLQSGDEPGGLRRSDSGQHLHEPAGAEPGLHGRGQAEHPAQLEYEPAAPEKASGELTESLFEPYAPQRIRVKGAKAHPTPLVQSAAMAAVEPPAVRYAPRLAPSVVQSGALSEAQIEQVVYAGQAHSDMLPDGSRRGYFIGDGTGVGKGREIAGILMDNWNHGRRKGVWVTFNASLYADAKRDLRGIGFDEKKLFRLSAVKMGEAIKPSEGILFTTYATLPNTPKGLRQEGSKTFEGGRLDQIEAWLGKDFDGVLVFDESHKMGNAIEMEADRGKKKPAQQALAGVDLQQRLPNARVVYVSATGATEPGNLSYLERMGLWGEGTAFQDKRGLIQAIEAGGVAAMELVSRDLKAMGGYLARTLSYDGVTYSRLEHSLTEHQHKAYDTYARAWQVVLENMGAAMEETGQAKNPAAKSAAMSLFWGSHQRFFGQVLTSMTMPSVLADIRKELEAGHSCVVQLTNTNEAAQERAMRDAAINGEDLIGLDITPRQLLMDYVRRGFPVAQFEEYLDKDGNTRTRAAEDSAGNPIENREAAAMRDALLERLGALKVPGNPLDMIVEEIGPNMVAEVTGRKRRVTLGKEERRGGAVSSKEAQEFMDGKRRVLVFSLAGGTGRSYHADRQAKNQQLRVHYILQPGWRADAATQGLGRTHRSNEALPPHYKLVTTDLQGHKRFTSSIARRLDQLGALTQGQRQTGSQGLFSASDNLENRQAADAWTWLAQDIYSNRVDGVSYKEFREQTGLVMEKKDESGAMLCDPPPIKQFLNRLLSMTVEFQNRVFQAFEGRLVDVYAQAEAQGTVDVGVKTLKAERVDVTGEKVIHKDERSGAETKALSLVVHERRKLQTFEQLLRGHGEPTGWWRNTGSGRVYGAYPGGIRQDEAGRLVERVLLRGVREDDLSRRPSLEELHESYEKVDARQARVAWDKTYEETPKLAQREQWLLTGMLLPVWNHISGEPNVYRLQDSEGRRHLGRILGRDQYNQTRKNLGLEVDLPKYSPKQALEAVLRGRRLTLRDGYVLEAKRVAGETRVEVSGEAVAWQLDTLKKYGAFSEIIQHRTRLFVPIGEKGEAFMARMLPLHPLIDESQGGARTGDNPAHFSLRPEAPEQGMSVNTVRGALQDLQARAKNARPLEVVQSFAELPKHIRRAARRHGLDVVEGVYDPREGKVWLVADGLTSRKRAVEVWMHEQCSHRGLRGLFGDDRRFRQFLRGVYEGAGGKPALRGIAADYGFDLADPADQLRAAEEYLSRLMEKVRAEEVLGATETRVWRRVVRFVKEMLNALGARVAYSDEEIASFLHDAVFWTFEGGREAAKDPSLAHDLAEWARQLEEREKGEAATRSPLRLGRTPDVFLKLGLPDLPMVMFRGKLGRIEEEHGIAANELGRLPALLDAPLAVFDSATEAGTYVAVLDMQDNQGRQVRAAIHPDISAGRIRVNLVASVYGGKQDIREWAAEQISAHRALYFDKKKGSPRLGDKSRLQLPGVAKAGSAEVRKKILTEADVVKRDPDVRFSIPARGESKALDSALDKIGAPRVSVEERVKALGEQFKAGFEQGVFDRFASLRKLDAAAGAGRAGESAYVAARMTTSLGDVMTAIVQHGAPVWREGAADVDGVGRGLASIMKPIAGEVDRWCAWMVGKRAEKLALEGRENLFGAEEIQALKGLNAGREALYDSVWREYARFKAKVLDFAQEAGVIDPAGRALWDHDEYIPFYRLMEEGGVKAPREKAGIASQSSGIRTLKGGTANIGDPFENIMRNFTHLVDAAVKNHAMDLAMKNAEATGAAQRLALRWEAVRLPAGAMQNALRRLFGDKDAVWPMSEAQRASLQTVFNLAPPAGKDVVHVLRGGRPEYYQVGDPLLLRSLTALNQAAIGGWFMRGARFFKRLLTRGVTATPEFMLRNLVRDTLSAWAVDNSGSFKPVLGSLRGLSKTLREDEDTVHMLAAGASFQGGYALGHDPAAARLLVDRLMRKHRIPEASVLNTPEKLGRFLKMGWQWWEEKGQAVENSTRADIYAQMRRRGATHLEAAYEAKNIMDYSMRGDWPAIRFLCETVPFFGARLVGLHRLARGYQANRRAFLLKGGMVALASVALFLRNQDEPEYQELEQFDRDNYYHFFVGGGHYRLPKPFEIGAIFGTLPERITEQFINDEATGELFAERMGYMLTQTFSLGVPQIVAPLVEQYANRSFFTDRPIVGRRLERLRPGEQRDPWTSDTAALLARALDDSGLALPLALRSPKRLEHLVNAYFGTLGMYALGAADVVTRWSTDAPDRPETRAADWPLVRSFYREGPARHTRQGAELYEMLREVEVTYATVMELRRTGDLERARELVDQNRGLLTLRRGASAVEERLAQFDKANRRIAKDARLDAAEKRSKLDALAEKRNAFVRRAHARLREGAGR